MRLKKASAVAVTVLLLLTAAVGCGKTDSGILVITREEGSGTRGAFAELFGLEEKGVGGNKYDIITAAAETTNNTAVVLQTVAGDRNAIGYISLGSLNDTVKALQIDGVAPSVQAIRAGEYQIRRPFSIVTRGSLRAQAQDFYNFITSKQGQAVAERFGCLPLENAPAYVESAISPNEKVRVSGSSSVSPLMERLIEAYEAARPGAAVELDTNDSTTGINNAISGVSDIGMASRALKESEIAQGAAQIQIATDGIAVIVSNENAVNNLTKEQIQRIYSGKITAWEEINQADG